MVESCRDAKCMVRQHTLLNLGAHYDLIPEVDHSILVRGVDNIITGQLSLLPLGEELETEAQRIANLIIKNMLNLLLLITRKNMLDMNMLI